MTDQDRDKPETDDTAFHETHVPGQGPPGKPETDPEDPLEKAFSAFVDAYYFALWRREQCR